jgi:hypothetical protein
VLRNCIFKAQVTGYEINARLAHEQGCQIFLGPKYQNGEKYIKLPQNIPKGHKIFLMAVK